MHHAQQTRERFTGKGIFTAGARTTKPFSVCGIWTVEETVDIALTCEDGAMGLGPCFCTEMWILKHDIKSPE